MPEQVTSGASGPAPEPTGSGLGGDGQSVRQGPRKLWYARNMSYVADEPLLLSLIKYRAWRDRSPATPRAATLVGSRRDDKTHLPIIDLDYEHRYVPSETPGHAHLYLERPVSRTRWWLLMIGLRAAHVIEPGFFWWSLRRGGNFVRLPGQVKTPAEQEWSSAPPRHGMLRRIRSS